MTTETSDFTHRKNQPPKKVLPHELKSQSTQFLSRVERFQFSCPKIPGPGSYDHTLK